MINLWEYFNKQYKGIAFLLVIVILSCMFGGCRKNQTENLASINEGYQQEYFIDTSHGNSKVSIKYPNFTGADMQPINEAFFEFVSELAEELYDDDYKDLQLELDFMVQRYDNKYLSISFCGTGNVHTAAHPNNIMVTQNFDLTTNKRFVLSDIYNIDMSFAELVKQKVSEQYSAEIASEFSETENLLKLLKDCDTDINGCQSYLTEQGVTVCLPVAHAIGDYIEVVIDGQLQEKRSEN